MTTFSERMTAARKDKKLTQDQVAQALGVSRQLVSHWENGRVEPTQEQREAICKLLDIPMDAPKPTPLHKRILAAAALIAFVAILVMAVYPIYKSRRARHQLRRPPCRKHRRRRASGIRGSGSSSRMRSRRRGRLMWS
ncbi:MAG: helix-turn-helix transcriptional regulator [Oscillospiraceae bacterium]